MYNVGMSAVQGGHRIGEFSRRVGVSPELLRAWEQRYGLLDPGRSPGGFRLYRDEDAMRVARMRRALDEGLSAAQAAQFALEGDSPAPGLIGDAGARLLGAIQRYDEAEVQAVFDHCLVTLGLEAFLRDLILPTLAEVGRRWQDGEAEVSQEHFASNLIRGRLLSLARFWGRGSGPLALLACPPGEHHDISLIAFGLLLRSHGWRILFLGADTPLATISHAANTTGTAAIVLAAFDPAPLETEAAALRRIARAVPLFISGPGASAAISGHGQVRLLRDDIVHAAMLIAQTPTG